MLGEAPGCVIRWQLFGIIGRAEASLRSVLAIAGAKSAPFRGSLGGGERSEAADPRTRTPCTDGLAAGGTQRNRRLSSHLSAPGGRKCLRHARPRARRHHRRHATPPGVHWHHHALGSGPRRGRGTPTARWLPGRTGLSLCFVGVLYVPEWVSE